MENHDSRNAHPHEASTDERASSFTSLTQGEPSLLANALAETFPPGGRKPRHDGFTAEAIARFVEDLAAHGIVEHAASAAGVPPRPPTPSATAARAAPSPGSGTRC